jgi:hypothetical protein
MTQPGIEPQAVVMPQTAAPLGKALFTFTFKKSLVVADDKDKMMPPPPWSKI